MKLCAKLTCGSCELVSLAVLLFAGSLPLFCFGIINLQTKTLDRVSLRLASQRIELINCIGSINISHCNTTNYVQILDFYNPDVIQKDVVERLCGVPNVVAKCQCCVQNTINTNECQSIGFDQSAELNTCHPIILSQQDIDQRKQNEYVKGRNYSVWSDHEKRRIFVADNSETRYTYNQGYYMLIVGGCCFVLSIGLLIICWCKYKHVQKI